MSSNEKKVSKINYFEKDEIVSYLVLKNKLKLTQFRMDFVYLMD